MSKQTLESILNDNLQTLQVHSQNIDPKLIIALLKNFACIKSNHFFLHNNNNTTVTASTSVSTSTSLSLSTHHKLPFVYQFFSKNSVLYHEGSPSNRIYFVLRGKVSLYMPKSFKELQSISNNSNNDKCKKYHQDTSRLITDIQSSSSSSDTKMSFNNNNNNTCRNSHANTNIMNSINGNNYGYNVMTCKSHRNHTHNNVANSSSPMKRKEKSSGYSNMDLSMSLSDDDRSDHDNDDIKATLAITTTEIDESTNTSSSMNPIATTTNINNTTSSTMVTTLLPSLITSNTTTTTTNTQNPTQHHKGHINMSNLTNKSNSNGNNSQADRDYKLFSLAIDRKGKYINRNGILNVRYFKSTYPGECVGLYTSVLGITRNHTAIAIEDTHFISIERDDFINYFSDIVYKIREQFNFYISIYEDNSSYFEVLKFYHALEEVDYMANEVLYDEGDNVNGLYIVLKGEIKIQKKLSMSISSLSQIGPRSLDHDLANSCKSHKETMDNQQIHFMTLGKYDLFGDESLLNKKTRRFTAISLTNDTLVHHINLTLLYQITKLCPTLYEHIKYKAQLEFKYENEYFNNLQMTYSSSSKINNDNSPINISNKAIINNNNNNTSGNNLLVPLIFKNTTMNNNIDKSEESEYNKNTCKNGGNLMLNSPVKANQLKTMVTPSRIGNVIYKKFPNSYNNNDSAKTEHSYNGLLSPIKILDVRSPANIPSIDDEDPLVLIEEKPILRESNPYLSSKRTKENAYNGSPLYKHKDYVNSKCLSGYQHIVVRTPLGHSNKSAKHSSKMQSFVSSMNNSNSPLSANLEPDSNPDLTQKLHNSPGKLAVERSSYRFGEDQTTEKEILQKVNTNELKAPHDSKNYMPRLQIFSSQFSPNINHSKRAQGHHQLHPHSESKKDANDTFLNNSIIESVNFSDLQLERLDKPETLITPTIRTSRGSFIESTNNSPKKHVYYHHYKNITITSRGSDHNNNNNHHHQRLHQPRSSSLHNPSLEIPILLKTCYVPQQQQLQVQLQQLQPRSIKNKPDNKLEGIDLHIRLKNEISKNKTQVISSKHNQFRFKPKNLKLLERYNGPKLPISSISNGNFNKQEDDNETVISLDDD